MGTIQLHLNSGNVVGTVTDTSGQPGQSCENPATSTTPGNAASALGSAFNPNGVSGGVYANGPGSTPNGQVTNPTAVSQYDVACFQNSQPH